MLAHHERLSYSSVVGSKKGPSMEEKGIKCKIHKAAGRRGRVVFNVTWPRRGEKSDFKNGDTSKQRETTSLITNTITEFSFKC